MLERPLYSTKSIGPRTFSMIVLPMDYILWLYNSFSKKVLDNTFFCHLEMINFVMCPHFKGSFELIKYSNVRFLFVKWLKTCLSIPKSAYRCFTQQQRWEMKDWKCHKLLFLWKIAFSLYHIFFVFHSFCLVPGEMIILASVMHPISCLATSNVIIWS